MKKKKYSSDTVISVSAIIIAVISIFVAVWEGMEIRKHNRLSVQPRIDVAFGLDFQDSLVYCTITNNGLGPAIIEDIQAQAGEKSYQIDRPDQLFNYLENFNISNIPITYDDLGSGVTVIPKSEERIFSIKIGDLERRKISYIEILNNSTITVKYKSLYEEEFTVSN